MTPDTEQVTVAQQTFDVLVDPLTYAQYTQCPWRDEDGVVTAVVSVSFDQLFSNDYDSNVDLVAPLVVSELGEDWTIEQLTPVGTDPREPSDPEDGRNVLVEVRLWPGTEASVGTEAVWAGTNTAVFAKMPPAVQVGAEREVEEVARPLRAKGHRPQVADPLTVSDAELWVVLLCPGCEGAAQLALDSHSGALHDIQMDGDFAGQERCPQRQP